MTSRSTAVLWPSPPKWTRNQLVKALRSQLKNRNIEAAYLFGSHSRGNADDMSDIDLILVTDSKRAFTDRFRDYSDLWDRFGAVDLLVYTPTEWKKMLTTRSTLIQSARKDWVRIL